MIAYVDLNKLLYYDPDTGEFLRLVSTCNRALAGGVAGHLHSSGYIIISINGVRHRAHRLAWLYVHGVEPACKIDHINGIRHDNRICNLRLATNSENGYNTVKHSNNTSGYKGVYWNKKAKKWIAQCYVSGKNNYLGLFTTAKEASDVYQAFAKKHHGEFYNTIKETT